MFSSERPSKITMLMADFLHQGHLAFMLMFCAGHLVIGRLYRLIVVSSLIFFVLPHCALHLHCRLVPRIMQIQRLRLCPNGIRLIRLDLRLSVPPSATYENPLGRMNDRISQKTDGGGARPSTGTTMFWVADVRMIRHPSSIGHPYRL
jgi:hypothetical protein